MWNLLHNYHGEVDLEFAKMTWRFPAETPSGEFEFRICNLNMVGLGIAQPDVGDEGLYYVSTGYPARVAYTSSSHSHSFRIAATYSFLFNFGSKVKVHDAQSGFSAYSKQTLNTISVTEAGISISVDTLIKARANGLKIREVSHLLLVSPVKLQYEFYNSWVNSGSFCG